MLQSDEEILGLCGVNLVFLDYTTYGIIKNIRAPNPTDTKKTPAPTPAHKKSSKTTCHDSTRKPTKQAGPKLNTTRGKRSRTLSESRQETFGISTLVRTLRSNRQTIYYLALNDGLEEDMPDSPKCRKKIHMGHEANHQPQDERLISTPIQQSQNLPLVQRTPPNYKPYHPHHSRKPTTNYQAYQLIKLSPNYKPYHPHHPRKPMTNYLVYKLNKLSLTWC